LFFKIVPPGTIFRNKKFCRDLFKKQNILQGPKTTKWVQSSCATYTSHHKNGVRDYFKKQKILQGPKTNYFFLQGPKLKRGIFAGTSAIFKPFIYKGSKCDDFLGPKPIRSKIYCLPSLHAKVFSIGYKAGSI